MIEKFQRPSDGTVVLAFGTFDKFHRGHDYVLTQAKTYGNHLIVIIARDGNVEKFKGKPPMHDEQTRLAAVQNHDAVTQAVLGFEDFSRRMEVIDVVQPNIIVLGYDQAPKFKSPSEEIEVVRLDSFKPEIYKSSLL